MNDYTERLIARLREADKNHVGEKADAPYAYHYGLVCHEAAFEIERLLERIKDLREELSDIRRQAGDATEYVLALINQDQAERIKDLEEERDQLRKAVAIYCRGCVSSDFEDDDAAIRWFVALHND